jgi:hypothetical protein
MKNLVSIALLFISAGAFTQNHDPLKAEIITADMDNFWKAYEAAKPDFKAEVFEDLYFKNGTYGLESFLAKRIKSPERLTAAIISHPKYFANLKSSTAMIPAFKQAILNSFVKLKEIYPKAIFPPVYFEIGAMNSGGTTSGNGILIGADMYGLTPQTDLTEMNDWHKAVLKSVQEIPHIVAHELIHVQQNFDGGSLLAACLKEGGADFIAELISGKHINQHVHDFANPREEELWNEFKTRMHEKDYSGWLYSNIPGRPNDLGYWMGYKIVQAYYDNAPDKQKAIDDFMNIKNVQKFLEKSRYAEKFEKG